MDSSKGNKGFIFITDVNDKSWIIPKKNIRFTESYKLSDGKVHSKITFNNGSSYVEIIVPEPIFRIFPYLQT